MRGDERDPGRRLAAAGWRQGAVIDEAGLATLGHGSFSCGIVLSQDCDIVHAVEIEPQVEIILGHVRQVARPDCLNGRNPRKLDLQISSSGSGPIYASLQINDRALVDKGSLAQMVPGVSTLDGEATALLVDWISKRYTRPAWPDAFNDRLQVVDRKLESLFKAESARIISGIWLALDPREMELGDGENYRLLVWLTVATSVALAPREYASATDFELRLEAILKSCPGLDVLEIELRTEADMTLDDLRRFRRFDRDYRSWGDRPGGARPPRGT